MLVCASGVAGKLLRQSSGGGDGVCLTTDGLLDEEGEQCLTCGVFVGVVLFELSRRMLEGSTSITGGGDGRRGAETSLFKVGGCRSRSTGSERRVGRWRVGL